MKSSINVVGIICSPVGIGLTDLPKSRGGRPPPCPPFRRPCVYSRGCNFLTILQQVSCISWRNIARNPIVLHRLKWTIAYSSICNLHTLCFRKKPLTCQPKNVHLSRFFKPLRLKVSPKTPDVWANVGSTWYFHVCFVIVTQI